MLVNNVETKIAVLAVPAFIAFLLIIRLPILTLLWDLFFPPPFPDTSTELPETIFGLHIAIGFHYILLHILVTPPIPAGIFALICGLGIISKYPSSLSFCPSSDTNKAPPSSTSPSPMLQ